MDGIEEGGTISDLCQVVRRKGIHALLFAMFCDD